MKLPIAVMFLQDPLCSAASSANKQLGPTLPTDLDDRALQRCCSYLRLFYADLGMTLLLVELHALLVTYWVDLGNDLVTLLPSVGH